MEAHATPTYLLLNGWNKSVLATLRRASNGRTMNRPHSFKIIFLVALFCIGLPVMEGEAQPTDKVLQPGYYTVIATYRLAQDDYASRYINDLNSEGIYAYQGVDPKRRYRYVYLNYYTDFNTAIAEMHSIRRKTRFAKAWVRVIGNEHDTDHSPVTLQIAANDTTTHYNAEGTTNDTSVAANQPVATGAMQTTSDTSRQELVHDKAVQKVKPRDTVQLILSLPERDAVLKGEVEVIDIDRSYRIGTLQTNTYTLLPDPNSKSGRLTLKAVIFGYKPQQLDVHFRLTPADTLHPFIARRGNYYIIKFDLIRYKKGDMYTMDNVYFYNNAAIMLPESQIQLEGLLAMMKENYNYKIRLHGHTNGKVAGELITMGPSHLFFALANDVKKGFGSAQRLSRERALTIKRWLMERGLDPNRMKIKAWGGTKMLYDQNRSSANKNVRVEVEILAQ